MGLKLRDSKREMTEKGFLFYKNGIEKNVIRHSKRG